MPTFWALLATVALIWPGFGVNWFGGGGSQRRPGRAQLLPPAAGVRAQAARAAGRHRRVGVVFYPLGGKTRRETAAEPVAPAYVPGDEHGAGTLINGRREKIRPDAPRPVRLHQVVFLSHVITAAVPSSPATRRSRSARPPRSSGTATICNPWWPASRRARTGRARALRRRPGGRGRTRSRRLLLPRGRARRAGRGEGGPGLHPRRRARSRAGRRNSAGPGVRRRHHVDGFRGPLGRPPAYLNADAAGRWITRGSAPAAVSWLIEQRSIGALGIDTMGIHPGADTTFGANRLLLPEHRIHLENLAGWATCPRPAAGSSSEASGPGAARAHRPPCSA